MRCKNCGNQLADGANFCMKCGTAQNAPVQQNNTDTNDGKKKKTTAIISIILAVAVLISGVLGYFVLYPIFNQQEKLERKLKKLTDKEVVEFYYDDFNADKTKEAFAVVGSGDKKRFSDGEIWFVSDNAGKQVKDNIDGELNGILEENSKKYISVEVENDDNTSYSYIYGVEKEDSFYEPEISGQYSHVHQSGDSIVTDSGEKIIIEEHTQKSLIKETTSVEEVTEAETTTEVTTTKKTTTTTKKAEINNDEMFEVYWNNRSQWEYSDHISNVSYMFLDFNSDNVPELVVNVFGGSGLVSTNSVYTVNPQTKTFKEFSQDESSMFIDWAANPSEYPKLYNGPDGRIYLAEDVGNAGASMGGTDIVKIKYNGSTLTSQNIFFSGVEYGNKIYEIYNNGTAQEVSESEFNAKKSEFYNKNTDLHLKYKMVSGSSYDSMSDSAKKSAILASYKAFSYDGFKQ